jgi:hypothetical protein
MALVVSVKTDPDGTGQEEIIPLDLLSRLMKATQMPNEAALSSFLGISAQAIYQAKKKRIIPYSWAVKVAEAYNVSLDWLILNRGSMTAGDDEANAINKKHFDYIRRRNTELTDENKELWEKIRELESEKKLLDKQNRFLEEENEDLRDSKISRDNDVEHYKKTIDVLLLQLQALTQTTAPDTSETPKHVTRARSVNQTTDK